MPRKIVNHEFVFLGPNGERIVCGSYEEASKKPELKAVFLDLASRKVAKEWDAFHDRSKEAVFCVRAHGTLDGLADVVVIFLEDVLTKLDAYYGLFNPFVTEDANHDQKLIHSAKVEVATAGVRYQPGLVDPMTKLIVQKIPNTLRICVDEVHYFHNQLAFFSTEMHDNDLQARTDHFNELRQSCWTHYREEMEQAVRAAIPQHFIITAKKEKHEFHRLLAEGLTEDKACDTALINVKQRGTAIAFKQWFKHEFGIDTLAH